MQITAKLNYLRIAPRKTRLVADLIRRKKVEQAQTFLNFTTKRAAKPILKLLKSAVANAKNNFQLEEQNLYISKIMVDEGPKLKRWLPRARGRADEILKRVSHITIVLEEIKPTKKKIKKTKDEKTKEAVKPLEKKEELEKTAEIKEQPNVPPRKAIKEKKKPKLGQSFKRIFRRKAF